MSNETLKQRTKTFALEVIQVVESLPDDRICRVLGNQLLRAGTSVGANYRAACRARSPQDFIYKLGNVEEEANEPGYWMELMVEAGKAHPDQVSALLQEASELCAIMVASIGTSRKAGPVRRSNRPTGNSALRTPHSEFRPPDSERG